MVQAVFLDRDGVINQKMPEGQYVTKPEEFRLLPGAVEAIRLLKDAGFLVFVVTNQRGIALGRYTIEDLWAIHCVLLTALERAGTSLDGIYVCPHEKDSCECRKPKPGLLLQAKRDFPQIDLGCSIMIGDAESDMEAGRRAGCGRCIRIRAGCAGGEQSAENLLWAAKRIVERNQ